jgi:CHAD domain-containing protein
MRDASSSTVKSSIEDFCRKYHNEDIHTEHVTGLALRLFDETRERFAWTTRDRAVLEAAARLHDIAYSVNPRRHRELGAAIVLREGLQGFSDPERAVVASVMLFHAGDWQLTRTMPPVDRLFDPARAARLGALLRIADGLDFGHVQDATIVRVQHLKRRVRVIVRSPQFPYNLERAGQKADLWLAMFPDQIQLVAAAPTKAPAPALIGPDLHLLEAARRLLSRQLKIVVLNVDGALKGENGKPLHDIRVAIRRLRAVLRAFRGPLRKTSAKPINRAFGQLNDALGQARDLDVWMEFLTKGGVRRDLARSPRWRGFIQHQQEHRLLELATVCRHLGGPAFAALRARTGRLLRVQLPQAITTGPQGSLRKLARRALRKDLRRALKLAGLRESSSPDDLHRLRIALRKARYLGEFFSPVLGAGVEELTGRLHAVEQALGKIHDIDVGLSRIAREGPPPPRRLAEHLRERRARVQARLDKEWCRLEQSAAQRAVREALRL